jgi:RNA polymerase sigma-70 factor (ECF subfamily)
MTVESLFVARADRRRVSFERLWGQERERVWRLCARLSGSTDVADDLAQEVSVQAWKGWENFRGQAAPSTWLHRIAVNVTLRWRERRRETTPLELAAEPISGEASPEQQAMWSDVTERTKQAMESLPDELRVPLVLLAWEGKTYREIAQVLEIPMGTVMSRLHNARQRLRRELADAL